MNKNYLKKYNNKNKNCKPLSWNDIILYCHNISNFLKNKNITGLIPIPRGGIIPAALISYELNIPIKNKIELNSDVIIDEIVDSGITLKKIKKLYPNNLFICLHVNKINFKLIKIKPDYFCDYVDKYVIYPWEKSITIKNNKK